MANLQDTKDGADYVVKRKETFATLDRFIVEMWGDRCKDRQPGCHTCELWAARDLLDTMIDEEV